MVDTPFVSENFQRSFRNTFPSQVSSGRDLHVSDVVVPVVDFTPTTATTSLPFDLLTSVNGNTAYTAINSAGSIVTVSSSPGFYRMYTSYISDAFGGFSQLYLEDSSGTSTVQFIRGGAGEPITKEDYLYIPTGTELKNNSFGGSGSTYIRIDILLTSLADVNGNLIQPNGYDPQ